MSLFEKPKFLFKTASNPKLENYHGKIITVDRTATGKLPGPIKVIVKKITGNVFKPQFYEINNHYLIGMLRFHAQILHDTSITEEQFQAFEEMILEAEKMPDTKPEMAEDGRSLADKIVKDVQSEKIQ